MHRCARNRRWRRKTWRRRECLWCEEFAARSPRFVNGRRRLGPHLERCGSDAIAGPSSDVWPAGWLARGAAKGAGGL
eukprot:1018876-Alexandrium_andersonii.AAC.1